VEIPTPGDWAGKSLKELALRPRYGLTLIAHQAQDRHRDARIYERRSRADDIIQAGDTVSLRGRTTTV